MSRISKNLKAKAENKVINFMGGNSYNLTPLETLKMIATSSIFGEPSYYRSTSINPIPTSWEKYSIFDTKDLTTDKLFIEAVNKSLDVDFKGTLEFAAILREEFNMRLNPAVIFTISVNHKDRVEFNKQNPNFMQEIAKRIIYIPSDVTNMFEYYLFSNGSKNNMPTILKRIFAKNLNKFSKYHIAKYKSKNLKDIVRVSHASSEPINELMKTGTIKLENKEKTWEVLKSDGKSWKEILLTISIPHFALLRNLRGIFEENVNVKEMKEILQKLENGVKGGKLFPFNYYTASKVIQVSNVNFKKEIISSLENCIDLAMENFPKLKGKTVCLSDNSGSAHGSFTSEYGSTKVAEIANLSSVITAYNSDEGIVGCFGDRLNEKNIVKQKRILEQLNDLDTEVGESTENGIWLFLNKIIKNKEHIDNLFIYSDQQAGHGRLYGLEASDYEDYCVNKKYIDVLKLIEKYRKKVNPKLNVFSIQVAGYNNAIIPQNIYRGAVLSGWTGKEAVFAEKLINLWNEKEGINN